MTKQQSSSKRPLILISNDDGYLAGGIAALTSVALEYGDVVVVAPETGQSGKSSSITIGVPLNATLVEQTEHLTRWAVNGTPADCAKLAITQLLGGRTPDLLLSGINHGFNTGNSAIYSGTMGVVFEGVFNHIASVAFSYGDYNPKANFDDCLPWVRQVIERVLQNGLPKHVCLNVNIPFTRGEDAIKGMKVTTGALGRWIHDFEGFKDPYGRTQYWMVGDYEQENPADTRTDLYWLKQNWVSVTPCHPDQTDYESMTGIEQLLG